MNYQITILPVGQGSCALWEGYENDDELRFLALFDCGGESKSARWVRNTINKLMQKMAERALYLPPESNVTHYLDYFFLSHQDKDHYDILEHIITQTTPVSYVTTEESITLLHYNQGVWQEYAHAQSGIYTYKEYYSFEDDKDQSQLTEDMTGEYICTFNSSNTSLGWQSEALWTFHFSDPNTNEILNLTFAADSGSFEFHREYAAAEEEKEDVPELYIHDTFAFCPLDKNGLSHVTLGNSELIFPCDTGIFQIMAYVISGINLIYLPCEHELLRSISNYLEKKDHLLRRLNEINPQMIQDTLDTFNANPPVLEHNIAIGDFVYGTVPEEADCRFIARLAPFAAHSTPVAGITRISLPWGLIFNLTCPPLTIKENKHPGMHPTTNRDRFSMTVVGWADIGTESGFQYVFPGDATCQNIYWTLENTSLLKKATSQNIVLIAPHHGSYATIKGSMKYEDTIAEILPVLLETLQPNRIYISAGHNDNCKHPAVEFINFCQKAKSLEKQPEHSIYGYVNGRGQKIYPIKKAIAATQTDLNQYQEIMDGLCTDSLAETIRQEIPEAATCDEFFFESGDWI